MNIKIPDQIIDAMIQPKDFFPGNPRFPLLIYKGTLNLLSDSSNAVQALLHKNDWTEAWVDKVYDFHHYHSNTHEVLVIIAGECEVQFGGEGGEKYVVTLGDVVILPAGVSHKSLKMSDDFQCIGAYPFDVGYDMNYGSSEEYAKSIENIKRVEMPKKDPVFGDKGFLFDYWR